MLATLAFSVIQDVILLGLYEPRGHQTYEESESKGDWENLKKRFLFSFFPFFLRVYVHVRAHTHARTHDSSIHSSTDNRIRISIVWTDTFHLSSVTCLLLERQGSENVACLCCAIKLTILLTLSVFLLASSIYPP